MNSSVLRAVTDKYGTMQKDAAERTLDKQSESNIHIHTRLFDPSSFYQFHIFHAADTLGTGLQVELGDDKEFAPEHLEEIAAAIELVYGIPLAVMIEERQRQAGDESQAGAVIEGWVFDEETDKWVRDEEGEWDEGADGEDHEPVQ